MTSSILGGFWTPPLCHPISSFGLPPLPPTLDDVIYKQNIALVFGLFLNAYPMPWSQQRWLFIINWLIFIIILLKQSNFMILRWFYGFIVFYSTYGKSKYQKLIYTFVFKFVDYGFNNYKYHHKCGVTIFFILNVT